MLSGCRPSPQVLPFGAKTESHDNEHRRQLEIMMKVSRRATFRFPQAAGHHDNGGTRIDTEGLSHCVVALKSTVSTLEAREGSFDGGIYYPRGDPWRSCTRLSACLCAGVSNHGQELQRADDLFAIVLAPVLHFRTNAEAAQSILRAYHKQLVIR